MCSSILVMGLNIAPDGLCISWRCQTNALRDLKLWSSRGSCSRSFLLASQAGRAWPIKSLRSILTMSFNVFHVRELQSNPILSPSVTPYPMQWVDRHHSVFLTQSVIPCLTLGNAVIKWYTTATAGTRNWIYATNGTKYHWERKEGSGIHESPKRWTLMWMTAQHSRMSDDHTWYIMVVAFVLIDPHSAASKISRVMTSFYNLRANCMDDDRKWRARWTKLLTDYVSELVKVSNQRLKKLQMTVHSRSVLTATPTRLWTPRLCFGAFLPQARDIWRAFYYRAMLCLSTMSCLIQCVSS